MLNNFLKRYVRFEVDMLVILWFNNASIWKTAGECSFIGVIQRKYGL